MHHMVRVENVDGVDMIGDLSIMDTVRNVTVSGEKKRQKNGEGGSRPTRT
jgi:hypothetical protein